MFCVFMTIFLYLTLLHSLYISHHINITVLDSISSIGQHALV